MVLTFLHGATYALLVPPWQGPDEPVHFQFLRVLAAAPAQYTPLPERVAEIHGEVTRSMRRFAWWDYFNTATPPADPAAPPEQLYYQRGAMAYYYLSLPFWWLVRQQAVETQLYALRLFSVLLQCLTVYLTYRLGREVLGAPAAPADLDWPLAAALVVALLPQYTFISASYNDDNLAPVLTSLALWAVVGGWRRKGSAGWLLAGLGAAGLATLAKRTAAPSLLWVGVSALVYAAVWTRSARLVVRALGWLSLSLAGLALAAGLAALSTGPVLPASLIYPLRFNSESLRWLALYWQEPQRLLAVDWTAALVFLSMSFWGWFGWLKAPLATGVMEIVRRLSLGLLLGALGGWLRLGWQARRDSSVRARWINLALLALSVGLSLAFLIAQFLIEPAIYGLTGRYLFPFVAAIGLLMVWGWQAWWPARWQWLGLAAGLGALALLDVIAVVFTIVPYFYSL